MDEIDDKLDELTDVLDAAHGIAQKITEESIDGTGVDRLQELDNILETMKGMSTELLDSCNSL